MSKGPKYFGDEDIPRCRWCEGVISEDDELGMESGYCSSKCYEQADVDEDEED